MTAENDIDTDGWGSLTTAANTLAMTPQNFHKRVRPMLPPIAVRKTLQGVRVHIPTMVRVFSVSLILKRVAPNAREAVLSTLAGRPKTQGTFHDDFDED